MAETAEPSDLELQILSLLWERGPMTARQVLERMRDGKPRAYTTVLSVMQVMEKKGLLTHRSAGQTHVYRPKVTRARVIGRLLGRLVNHVFGGDPSAAVQSLLQQTPVSPEELAQIRSVVEQHAAEAKDSSKQAKKEGER